MDLAGGYWVRVERRVRRGGNEMEKNPITAKIQAIDSVNMVAEYMANNFPANQLVGIAESLGRISPLLWGHYQGEPCIALQLIRQPLTVTDDELPPN
jgi:hypothetical protein